MVSETLNHYSSQTYTYSGPPRGPSLLILDSEEPLERFRASVGQVSELLIHSLVCQIVDRISRPALHHRWTQNPGNVVEGSSVWFELNLMANGLELPQSEVMRSRISQAILDLSTELCARVQALGAYHQGSMPYVFHSLRGNVVVLQYLPF